jgi:hypothetical protein
MVGLIMKQMIWLNSYGKMLLETYRRIYLMKLPNMEITKYGWSNHETDAMVELTF